METWVRASGDQHLGTRATLVMVGYAIERVARVCEQLAAAHRSPVFVATLLIWNNERPKWPGCPNVQFVEESWQRNGTTDYAYQPRIHFAAVDRPDNLFTAAVLLDVPSTAVIVAQDDVRVSEPAFRCLLNIWTAEPRLVVGPSGAARAFAPDGGISRVLGVAYNASKQVSSHYGTRCTNGAFCLFTPQVFIISKTHLRRYSEAHRLREALNDDMRCEDHALAAVVGSVDDGLPMIHLAAEEMHVSHRDGAAGSLSTRRIQHQSQRASCASKVRAAWSLPLRPSTLSFSCDAARRYNATKLKASIEQLVANEATRRHTKNVGTDPQCCTLPQHPRSTPTPSRSPRSPDDSPTQLSSRLAANGETAAPGAGEGGSSSELLAQALTAANNSWCEASKRAARVPRRYSPGWREQLASLYPQLASKGLALPDDSADVYQFGVWGDQGGSLARFRRIFSKSRIFGFDSFTGLPASARDEPVLLAEWKPGSYAVGTGSRMNRTLGALHKKLAGGRGSDFVVGYYSDSLTPGLASERGMLRAAYVDIDCDLFSSTTTVLRWLLDSGLIVPGTLLGYDDWWVQPCASDLSHPVEPAQTGEWRAHIELMHEYRVVLTCAAGSCAVPHAGRKRCDLFNSFGPIFRVAAIRGRSAPPLPAEAAGFEMTAQQVRETRETWAPCLERHRRHHVVT